MAGRAMPFYSADEPGGYINQSCPVALTAPFLFLLWYSSKDISILSRHLLWLPSISTLLFLLLIRPEVALFVLQVEDVSTPDDWFYHHLSGITRTTLVRVPLIFITTLVVLLVPRLSWESCGLPVVSHVCRGGLLDCPWLATFIVGVFWIARG